tara:strand:+ start:184 stop:537 length:354 start_codon:yes stop_codon:yes gene_type:complete
MGKGYTKKDADDLDKFIKKKIKEADSTKITIKKNINLNKAKAQVKMKLGDKLNAELQGYGKTKNLIKGDLAGSNVKGNLEYKSGKHSIKSSGEYNPNSKSYSLGATYKLSFKKGGKI